MTWHYAAGGERHGPVDDAELDRLIAAGVVTGDTLVWHAGLDGWRPLREARPAALLADAAAPHRRPSPPPRRRDPVPTPTPSSPASPAGASRRCPRSSAAMALVFAQPGPTIGISALIMVMMMAAGFVPCVGSLVQIAVMGPLTAAWYGYFLKHIRGQPAALEDVFAVFSSPDLMHMIVVHVIVSVISMLLIVPIVVRRLLHDDRHRRRDGRRGRCRRAGGGRSSRSSRCSRWGCCRCRGAWLYVTIAFMFAPALILDRGHAFWPAMRLSQRVVNRQLLPMLGLVLLSWLIGLAGLLALCLGIFVAAPIVVASYAYAYEDLFGEAA